MQKKYQDKGVVLVALSDEDSGKVSSYVKAQKLPYIVADDAKSTEQAYGIRGFPTMFIIGPDGKVAWTGHPMQAEPIIEKLLKEKPPTAKGRLGADNAAADLAKADACFEKEQYGEAMRLYKSVDRGYKGTKFSKQAAAQIKKMKADEKIMALVKTQTEERINKLLEIARKATKAGDTEKARKYYERVISQYPGNNAVRTAKTELADLKKQEKSSDSENTD